MSKLLCPNSMRFFPNFRQIKTLRGALAPPASYTTAVSNTFKQCSTHFSRGVKNLAAYPFVAPSSAVDKQPRVCNQRQQEREMRQRSAPSRHHHDMAVPSAVLHSPNCIDNTDQFASQSSEVKKAVGRAESAPFVNNA